MRSFMLFLLSVMISFLSSSVFSQNKLKLTGTVSDSTKPLPMVTVRIFKKDKPEPLQATLSKENGNYQLNKPDTGSYSLSFTHTGFSEKRIDIQVTSADGDMQVEPVQLSKTTEVLQGVTVKAQRPLVEQSDDKIVFNAEDDPATKTETAIDILRKTPFVTVDGEDNIKVNGKDNFKVLLNGKETSMFARNVKEALRGFPGNLISKIEVITAPSAKYDGEGVGGLINIITKKKVAGYNGSLSSFSRTSDKLNDFDVNGNAKFGKFGFSIFYAQGFQNPVSQRNINTTIPTDPIAYSKRILDGDQRNSSGWAFGNAELSFEADSLNTISLYSNIDSWSNKTISDQLITTEFTSSPATTSNYHVYNKSNNPGVNVGSDYIKHFKKNKERELSLRFLGEFGKSNSEVNSEQVSAGSDRFLMNNSHAINNQYTLQFDNIIPLKGNTKIEGGAKAILRRASSDFQSQVKYDAGEIYKTNPFNTDYFKYAQDVISIYGMYSFKVKKSSFRLGARVEYTTVNGDFVTSKTKVKNDYATFLPNLQYTNKLSSVTTLVLSYTKRLQRPYIWDLNPFVNNNDSLNITFGNPELGPQTTHAISSQLRFGKGNVFAGINLEGTYSGNKILQYSSYDPVSGVTKTTSLNIGKEVQSSININLNAKITKKWSVFANGSLRYATVKNNNDASQSNSGFGTNFFANTTYRFSEKFSASTLIGLWKDPQTIQTTYPFMTWHNVAVNYKIFKNKLSISLRAVNYYEKTRDFKTIVRDKNFYSTNINTRIRRGGVLALTWNFGKLNENVSKKKGVSNDDILSKPAAPSNN